MPVAADRRHLDGLGIELRRVELEILQLAILIPLQAMAVGAYEQRAVGIGKERRHLLGVCWQSKLLEGICLFVVTPHAMAACGGIDLSVTRCHHACEHQTCIAKTIEAAMVVLFNAAHPAVAHRHPGTSIGIEAREVVARLGSRQLQWREHKCIVLLSES